MLPWHASQHICFVTAHHRQLAAGLAGGGGRKVLLIVGVDGLQAGRQGSDGYITITQGVLLACFGSAASTAVQQRGELRRWQGELRRWQGEPGSTKQQQMLLPQRPCRMLQPPRPATRLGERQCLLVSLLECCPLRRLLQRTCRAEGQGRQVQASGQGTQMLASRSVGVQPVARRWQGDSERCCSLLQHCHQMNATSAPGKRQQRFTLPAAAAAGAAGRCHPPAPAPPAHPSLSSASAR